jgi:periplasmic protein TonB
MANDMTRGLPYSLAVHTLALVVFFIYGSTISRAPLEPPRSIRVKMVHLPQVQPEQAEPVEQPEVQKVTPKEILPDLPPKELPKPKPEVKKPVEKPEEPPVVQKKPIENDPDPVPEDSANEEPEAAVAPITLGASVESVDSDFPFSWYLARMKSLIDRNWTPRQLGFGKNAIVSCAVHFEVARGGAVSRVTLIRSSGIGVYDRETLRAVQTTNMPPLPPQYAGSSLGVTFIFNLEPGS